MQPLMLLLPPVAHLDHEQEACESSFTNTSISYAGQKGKGSELLLKMELAQERANFVMVL